jgi:uncharacterized protein YdeI (YjbR/CyaY-like superfamily)
MTVPHNERATVHVESRAQWSEWLRANHATSDGVWLVTWRAATGRPALAYEEAVEELLRVGWVDGKARRVDEERTGLWCAPRRARSGWSRPNKQRVARLEAAGLMLPAGAAAVAAAKASGTWSLLDDTAGLGQTPRNPGEAHRRGAVPDLEIVLTVNGPNGCWRASRSW